MSTQRNARERSTPAPPAASAPVTKILIANRGEVAVRIARTCRELGVPCVAVFSDADADALHVRAADQAVRIGAAPSAESYLDPDKIIAACRTAGADAIHPGFGFLSENAAFAARCADEGIVFIGPSPAAIEAMGSKQNAKALAEAAGVPTVPGYHGAAQDDATLIAEAQKIGFPCLIKASAGGGGKGMRVVRADAELAEAIGAARREASSGFGDPTLLIERYLERPRHIEIQILGDSYGNVIHLFERECSIQRRHQKIIEEAPSPFLDDDARVTMGRAAVRLAKEIGYTSAGTVEFIVDQRGDFYFLEVNTRLQVEHPVTEEITGIDLVRAQIQIAGGGELGMAQEDCVIDGASIECRIYAEDPANDFLPASGRIHRWASPELDGLRIESGVASGTNVGIHYDPMLAKLITWGSDRDEVLSLMITALRKLQVVGIRTNRAFLLDLLESAPVQSGDLHTHLIDELYPDGWTPKIDHAALERAAIAATLHAHATRRAHSSLLPAVRSGFRNNRFAPQHDEFLVADQANALRVEYIAQGDGLYDVMIPVSADTEADTEAGTEADAASAPARRYRVADAKARHIELEDERMLQQRFEITYERGTSAGRVFVQSLDGTYEFDRVERFPLPGTAVPTGGSVAPMTGTVIDVRVAVGDTVEAGDALVILEAMKMEHRISAAIDGTVAALHVAVGDVASEGDTLVVLE